MFLARAQFEFKDNGLFPDRAGADCQISGLPDKPEKGLFQDKTTVADLLMAKDPNGFGYYHVRYDAARGAGSACGRRLEETINDETPARAPAGWVTVGQTRASGRT
jgi:hypothetical protein